MPHPLNFYIDKSGNIFLYAVGEPTGGRCYFCFRLPFADRISQSHPRKSYRFCSLPGKSANVLGNPSRQGKNKVVQLLKFTIAFYSKMAYIISGLRSSSLCRVVTMEALLAVDALLLLNRIRSENNQRRIYL